ncbi:MAG TPA: DUF6677 family protein [Terriglobales bacterium]|nr:DUF6677 family protein [Terriglobales bacterium]
MATTPTRREPITAKPASASTGAMSIVVPAVAWLVPGAGHLMQKRCVRGVLLMASIVLMFVLGILMDGRVYRPNGGDILDILGFIGDLGAGGMYIVSRAMDLGHMVVPHATADYGTKYIIVAGLLNFISVADAYHIAIGKKA